MNKKKIITIVLIVLAIIGALFFACNKYVDYLLTEKMVEPEVINEEDVVPEEVIEQEPVKEADKVVNFLIIGADNLDLESGRNNSWKQERSDVMKIVSLDYTTKKIKITSLDRDLVEYFPQEGYEDFYRFNWAYSFGLSKLAIASVNYNLDLDITKYVSTSFAGFIKVIDAIGGIDINLTAEEAKAFNLAPESDQKMTIKAVEGVNHLNGHDALCYARERNLDSDYIRMDRQTQVIKKVIEKLKTMNAKDLLNVASTALPYVSTNLTVDEIGTYLVDIIDFDLANIETTSYPETLEAKDVYWNYSTDMGGYVLKDYEAEVIRIHKFIYEVEEYKLTNSLKETIKKAYELFPYVKEGKPSGV